MLYCEQCADVLFTHTWKDARPLRVAMDPEDLRTPEGKQAMFEVIDAGIVLRAKRRGLTAYQARSEAHALGQLWWKKQDAAAQRPSIPLPAKVPNQSGPLNAGATPLSARPPKQGRVVRHAGDPRRFIALAAIILVCLVIGVRSYDKMYVSLFINPLFQDRIEDFIAPSAKNTPFAETRYIQAERPYVKGKILIINKRDRIIDALQMSLPAELRARKPDEVGTIVWLEESESKVGYYGHDTGASGFVRVVDISLVDLSRNTIIDKRQFRGAAPPQQISRGAGDQRGPYPSAQVHEYLHYLASLRRS